MASPEQGESAAGSRHSTPVPEEMDFDLFGRQWSSTKCLLNCGRIDYTILLLIFPIAGSLVHKLPNSSVSKASQPPWMRILKSMRRRFGAPTTVLFGFSFGLDCFAFRSNVPEVITGSSATTKTVHIATCTAQQSWTRCIRFRTRKLRKRKRPFTSGVTIGSPGAITGSSISICHVRLHRRNTCEPCIGFAQMRLKSRS